MTPPETNQMKLYLLAAWNQPIGMIMSLQQDSNYKLKSDAKIRSVVWETIMIEEKV